jgi:rare lipoprotein A
MRDAARADFHPAPRVRTSADPCDGAGASHEERPVPGANLGPERGGRCQRADNLGMMTNAAIGSAFSVRDHVPGPRLARAQRFAALLLLSLFALGSLVPGDAIARAVKDRTAKAKRESGWCSYYGRGFYHRRTASGERFDPDLLTAAHRTLPFGTRVRVTNLANGRRIVVRINDRGPFKSGSRAGRDPRRGAQAGLRHLGAHARAPGRARQAACRLRHAHGRAGAGEARSQRQSRLNAAALAGPARPSTTGGGGAAWTSIQPPALTTAG